MQTWQQLREQAKKGRDPACDDATLALILGEAKKLQAKSYLEIGAGIGLTSVCVFRETGAAVTAIEKDPSRAAEARAYFAAFGVKGALLEGDAGDILPCLGGPFDVIFLDGPKAQYRKYFPELKRLLAVGGVLFSDDVLLYGWVRGEPPKKRRMLVEHIREYLALLEADPDLETQYFSYGEGLALSRRLR